MKAQFLKLADGNYRPAFEHDEEVLDKIKAGEYIFGRFTKPRNPGHHRKAFALLKAVFDNQEKYTNITDLLVEFKLKAGWYVEHISMKNGIVYVPKSIDFNSLGQDEFEDLYRKFVHIAADSFGFEGASEFL